MVMLDLFERSDYPVGIAHCNFKLRGDESDMDADFVQGIASERNISFYYTSFDTIQYARDKGLSIQMAARELRYGWFEEIRKTEGFDLISTGHNLDDNVETFFVNLLRGTGLAGLTGIPVKSGKVIRPILFATRNDIEEYAKDMNIRFRTDSSNNETKYLRNKIRHEIVPLLNSLQNDFNVLMDNTMQRLDQINGLYIDYINLLRNDLLKNKGERFLVSISSIKNLKYPETVLFELLKPFGINTGMLGDLLYVVNHGISGKQLETETHILTRDRDFLLIDPKAHSMKKQFIITRCKPEIIEPVHLEFKVMKMDACEINDNPNMAYLDHDKIEFPLKLRKWQKGDVFYPLGMKNSKKLSDFFIDQKVSLPDKEKAWLLCSGNDIVWVVGYRIDDRFKVTGSTKKVFVVRFD